MARAGGERTWSRAGGQGADERGFTIRQDCILFIFSRTRPTRRGTDRERQRGSERGGGREEEMEKHNECKEVCLP